MARRGRFSLRPFERRRLATGGAQHRAWRVAHWVLGRFAFAMTDDSFAQLSFGRHAGRVVFFAAWREKATGLLFTRVWGASSMQKNPYYTARRPTRPDRRLSMRDAAP